MATTKQPTKRQMAEEARATALAGNWVEAATLNRVLIERDKKDAESWNRLGRALLEQGDYAGALEAYGGAFKADPANMIARRNLRRLEYLRGGKSSAIKQGDVMTASIPRTSELIEEVGKTWVDELVHPLSMVDLAVVLPGEQLLIEVDGSHLHITDGNGKRLGEIDQQTGERVIRLIKSGYRYEVFALGLSSASLRVILREVFRDPSLEGAISFPRQISRASRYLREREALRKRDESDFLPGYEEDDLEDEEATGSAADEEDAGEAESFEEEETTNDSDEEEHRL